MVVFAGWQRHLHLAKETDWGTLAGSPTYIPIPYATYTVRPRLRTTQAQLFTGLRQRRHHRIVKATLEGSISCPLHSHHVAGKSLAQHLLEWLISAPNALFLDSHTAELFEGNTDNKRHLGLRPARGTIRGDADSGAIQLSMELQGKEEEGGISPPSLSATTPQPTEFLFKDATFSLNGSAVELQSFEIEINNNVQVYHNNSYWPSLVTAGVREVSYRFSLIKEDATFDAMRRVAPADANAQLVLKGPHNGTGPSGNFATITIQLDRLGFNDAEESGDIHELAMQDLDLVVLKPSSTDNEIDFAFGTMT